MGTPKYIQDAVARANKVLETARYGTPEADLAYDVITLAATCAGLEAALTLATSAVEPPATDEPEAEGWGLDY